MGTPYSGQRNERENVQGCTISRKFVQLAAFGLDDCQNDEVLSRRYWNETLERRLRKNHLSLVQRFPHPGYLLAVRIACHVPVDLLRRQHNLDQIWHPLWRNDLFGQFRCVLLAALERCVLRWSLPQLKHTQKHCVILSHFIALAFLQKRRKALRYDCITFSF